MPQGKPSKYNLLTISQASNLLGVSKTTLRCWTDEGKVKTFVTPGGHRRYAETELRNLLQGQRQFFRVKDLVAVIESVSLKQRELAQQYLHSAQWYEKLDDQSRERLRQRGRELLHLVSHYIAKPSSEGEIFQAAHLLGQDFGMELAKLGLSLADALEAFLLHRTPVVNSALGLLKSKEAPSKRILTAIAQINRLLDEVLLSLVKAYQEGSSRTLASNIGSENT